MGRVKSTKNSKEDEDQSTTGLILSKFNSIQQTLDVKMAGMYILLKTFYFLYLKNI